VTDTMMMSMEVE